MELVESKEPKGITGHHNHVVTEDDAATRDWYAKHFGGKRGTRGI